MPCPINILVGARIRKGRWLRAVTQQQLGDAARCTPQQIQKYETGIDQVSAQQLWYIAQALDQPVSYFFKAEKQAAPYVEPVFDR